MLPPPPQPRQTSWDPPPAQSRQTSWNPPSSRSNREKVIETIDTPNLNLAIDLRATTARGDSQGSSRIRTFSAKRLTSTGTRELSGERGKENRRPLPRKLESALTKPSSNEDTFARQSDTSLLESSFSFDVSCSMLDTTEREEPTYRSKQQPGDRMSQIEDQLM